MFESENDVLAPLLLPRTLSRDGAQTVGDQPAQCRRTSLGSPALPEKKTQETFFGKVQPRSRLSNVRCLVNVL